MKCTTATLFLAALQGSAALRVPLQPHSTKQPQPSLATATTAALTVAAAPIRAALAYEPDPDFWVEINKPPIEFGDELIVRPSTYLFFALYLLYIGFSIFGPASASEKAFDERVKADAAAAASVSGPFLKAAQEEEGAITTATGLIYKELQAGTGASPTASDSVSVHYVGTLSDGTKFDSSRDRGEPSTFNVGQVIKGWQEGLQLMKVGGKAKLTIPAELAYGPNPMGVIPGSSVLQFEVELMEIAPPEKKFGLF